MKFTCHFDDKTGGNATTYKHPMVNCAFEYGCINLSGRPVAQTSRDGYSTVTSVSSIPTRVRIPRSLAAIPDHFFGE